MLLALTDSLSSDDPYIDIAKLSGETRDRVKKFITVSLGANDEEKAFGALK